MYVSLLDEDLAIAFEHEIYFVYMKNEKLGDIKYLNEGRRPTLGNPKEVPKESLYVI